MCGPLMAQSANIIRFRCFAYPGTKLCVKNITKRHKSDQRVFYSENLSDNVPLQNNEVKKVAKYRRIASENKLDPNDFFTTPQTVDETQSIFKEIAQDDAEIKKKLELLFYEIMLKREEEEQVPSVLKKQHWEELLQLPTSFRRDKYLSFLYKTEKKKESQKIKDALKKIDTGVLKDLAKDTPHIYYGLGGYSMFLRIYSQTLNPLQDIKSLTNKFFAPPILFDCSYQEYMNELNTKFCAKQIALSVQLNRAHPHPCTLQLFNLKKDDLLVKYLKVSMQHFEQQLTPFEVYESSFLDVHPKEKLVYLTPHTSHFLQDFSSDDIYIIGAYVDRGEGIQASLARAKELGLRMAKLPLDKYLLWKQGTKSLTLNNVLNILLDMRFYRNWPKALRSVPTRNIR